MFLHFIDFDGKYTNKYLDFLKRNFDISEHFFSVIYRRKPPLLDQIMQLKNFQNRIITINITRPNLVTLMKLIQLLSKADHIFFHGLFNPYTMVFFNLLPFFLKKSSWVLWGGDLYNYWLKNRHNFKETIIELMKKRIIKHIDSVIALVEEDYHFMKKKYETQATYRFAFYPNPISYECLDYLKNSIKKNSKIIMIGNSATETNRHHEILEALKDVLPDNFDYEIICPLSYGDSSYAKFVISLGEKLFGKKFVPLTQFLDPHEYSKILASVDIAIFNHKRQQGLGNILALLYSGKKVYIRSDVSTWQFLNRIGITVYDTIKILNKEETNLFDFEKEIGDKNRQIVLREFSEKRCVELWKSIFDELRNKKGRGR